MMEIIISTVLMATNDGQDKCFLDSRRKCFYTPVIVTENNRFKLAGNRNQPVTVTQEILGISLRNSLNGVFIGGLQAIAAPVIKHH